MQYYRCPFSFIYRVNLKKSKAISFFLPFCFIFLCFTSFFIYLPCFVSIYFLLFMKYILLHPSFTVFSYISLFLIFCYGLPPFSYIYHICFYIFSVICLIYMSSSSFCCIFLYFVIFCFLFRIFEMILLVNSNRKCF